MPPLADLLREEIARLGPIPFRRFMELALYHPSLGYYTRDPFGASGDFYTASQLQPVFGQLVAARVRSLYENLGRPDDFTVVELGPGRGEMAPAFSEWRYVPVERHSGMLPERFTGVAYANEFFDALPVSVARLREGVWHELRVGWNGERFIWNEAAPVDAEQAAYIDAYLPGHGEGDTVEINLDALGWIERIAAAFERGYLLTIDYGYTSRESAGFPQGTLMSYRRHVAREDVLEEPGLRDVTAHVCFTALEEHGRARGLERLRLESLASTLLGAGEAAVATAVAADDERESARRRHQLQTLLFSMGETFRVLLQKRV